MNSRNFQSFYLVAWMALLPAVVMAQATSEQTLVEQSATAIEHLRAQPLDPKSIGEARSVGFTLLRSGTYDKALEVFRAVMGVQKEDYTSMYGAALALFNLRRLSEAEALVRVAITTSEASTTNVANSSATKAEVTAQTADELVLLGVVLAARKDDQGALKAVNRAVELSPRSFDAQLALGRARYGTGDPSGAVEAFRAALALVPDNAQALFFLATALERAEDYASSLAAYRELVRLRPAHAEGHLGLGVLLVKLGSAQTEEGIDQLKSALRIDGDLYEARVTIGRALIRVGRPRESLDHLLRAAELAPNNPEPHYQLAIAYRRLGMRAEAELQSAKVRDIHAERRGQPVEKP
jgi:tetratricopeptide (TPR) repeat protein